MEWVSRDRLDDYNLVDDFMELLRVFDSPDLTEFQYVVHGDTWIVSIQ